MEQSTDCHITMVFEEVMYSNLFPFLNFGDLLRLRRVCKQLKLFSDSYIRNHFHENEREINETDHTVENFLSRGDLPTSHIYLNNSGPEFFEDPSIPAFLELHATKLTRLRVKHFATCISAAENNFFCALINLQHLELEYTDAGKRSCVVQVNGRSFLREKCYYPPTFRNLKTLKLNEIVAPSRLDQGYAWSFVEFCTKLEHFKHPFYKNIIEECCEFDGGPFGCVMECIKKRLKVDPNSPILKTYDFGNYEENGFYCFVFIDFVKFCYDHKIKILNLEAPMHNHAYIRYKHDYRKFAEPLVSAKNLHGAMFLTELPNLEKVVIDSIANSSFLHVTRGSTRSKWPKLKILDINIDSDKTKKYLDIRSLPTSDLFEYLFQNGKRRKLKHLALRYPKDADRSDQSTLPVPRVTEIVRTCRNVTRLTLSNWIGTNNDVSQFWDRLLHLEEVVLDECKMLAETAFVGNNRENPSFLKLTKMRRLALHGLDEMPKLTDSVFHLVFRHLKIKEFQLTSNNPVNSITINGIRSLLHGQFNTSVERFSFENWSLQGVSRKDFAQLKSEFRASYIL